VTEETRDKLLYLIADMLAGLYANDEREIDPKAAERLNGLMRRASQEIVSKYGRFTK